MCESHYKPLLQWDEPWRVGTGSGAGGEGWPKLDRNETLQQNQSEIYFKFLIGPYLPSKAGSRSVSRYLSRW